ncbi:MAG TPA: cysteine hydrolase family protein [Ktedonobacteraceae bacterium]|nr:cysteine hydrolase family protein [Ktedonobacteraceae bacterium]
MDPQKTAVVLIEYQNDFTSDGGTLHDAVKDVMEKENMLPNTVEMVEKARELGATIIHAPITFTNDYHELSPNPYGILKGVVDSKSFRKGTWGAEIVQDLTPLKRTIPCSRAR